MPEKVTGFFHYQREKGEEFGDQDSMTVLLHYKKGPLVTLKASVINVEPNQLRFWIRGIEGTFKKASLLNSFILKQS
jgi:hypothetical protein